MLELKQKITPHDPKGYCDAVAHFRGLPKEQGDGVRSTALGGRPALTHYTVKAYAETMNQRLVQIQIWTGRQHQIRRHFDLIGHPVMGDPRYGTGNKNRTGLQLTACGLAFTCPFGNGNIHIAIDPEKKP